MGKRFAGIALGKSIGTTGNEEAGRGRGGTLEDEEVMFKGSMVSL